MRSVVKGLLVACTVQMAHPLPASAAVTPLEGLDRAITTYMSEWKVPGLAIAVVQDGKVIHIKGYGFRDVDKKLPVTVNTQVAIGSITKSFTAVALGTLVDEGKLAWDRPVRDYVPQFQLYDPAATERITFRDLMSHRTGMPSGHDFFMYHCGFDQQEMLERLRYLEPNKDLRTTFQYSNLMVMIAGYLAGQVAGTTWEDLTRQRILIPVGMDRTSFSIQDFQNSGDFAMPYRRFDDDVRVYREFFMLDFDIEAAAGAILSSIEDMSRYMIFLLKKGQHGTARILSEENAAEMQTPEIPLTRGPTSFNQPEFENLSYGLGLIITSYRGHKQIAHSGNLEGFGALMSFLPKEDLGVVMLTNLDSSRVNPVVTNEVFDRLLSLKRIDWAARYKAQDEASADDDLGRAESTTEDRTNGPSHDLDAYAGEYAHPGYGVFKVEREDDGLRISNRTFSSALRHVSYDVFEFRPAPDEPDWWVRLGFSANLRGEIDRFRSSLSLELQEIVFLRRDTEQAETPAR